MAKPPRPSLTLQPSSLTERKRVRHIDKAVSAEAADLAGIPELEPFLTLDTEYGCIFTLLYGPEGPMIDTYMDVSELLGMTALSLKTAEKLTGMRNGKVRAMLRAISLINLRVRLDAAVNGPYLVKTETPLARDALELYLRALSRAELISLLNKAKV